MTYKYSIFYYFEYNIIINNLETTRLNFDLHLEYLDTHNYCF